VIALARGRVAAAYLAAWFWLQTSNTRFARRLLDPTGAIGDVKMAYAASSNLTVTNLNSLAASSTWLTGWQSAAVDQTTPLYEDYALTAKITAAATNTAAGEIRMYVVAMLDDSTWPDTFGATEASARAVTSAEIRDSICKLAAVTATTATASRAYYLHCPSVAQVFGGILPLKFVVFITHTAQTTTNTIAASGNQVTIKGIYRNIAQS
jgi:hypothetical protein